MVYDSSTKDLSKSGGSRWWEYYAMRYALGVGIGTPLVALLLRTYTQTLSPKVSITYPSGTVEALFWAAAGTAYCYVASVPMLTLHSTRMILVRTKFQLRFCFIFLVCALVIAGAADAFLVNLLTDRALILELSGGIVLVLIVGAQIWALWKVLQEPDDTHQFYDRLSKQRIKRTDFAESYRHMREHGNAVSIVIFEFLLAFVLWSLRPLGSVGGNAVPVGRGCVILAVWLAPSALVWLIGSSLERYLSRSKS